MTTIKTMDGPKLSLVEVFRSPQGEGYNAGRTAVFVRFAGCNLACHFADGAVCDTPYQHATLKGLALDEVFRDHILPLVRKDYTLDFNLRNVEERRSGSWKRDEEQVMLIFTGGEPTMAPAFDQAVEQAVAEGFYVAVETNGTKWRESLRLCDWLCVSPKTLINQGSLAKHHNHNPQNATLDPRVVGLVQERWGWPSAEYRFVITSRTSKLPPYLPAFRHYLSPAVISDGSGEEWKTGKFPGFVEGAMERCLELIAEDPRWRLSVQQHKYWGVR